MKTSGEIRRLERMAEQGSNEEAFEAMTHLKKINRTYHYCAEWDYAVICDTHAEWDSCICDLPNGEGRLNKIPVYGTKEGKLYIKPEELFALPKIQELIRKIANSPTVTVTEIKKK